MSKYDDLADKATPRPWYVEGECHGDDHYYYDSEDDLALSVTLANNADNFKRLWEAANDEIKTCQEWAEVTRCEDCGWNGECQLPAAVEALRPLFGEDGAL